MEIVNERVFHTQESTIGILKIDNIPFGFIIEDEPRAVKVKGETRIPAGKYKLGIKKELTPLTIKHRANQYYKGWFLYHIEVKGVPGFGGIYFHIGNTEKHTEGCQIGAKTIQIRNGEFTAINSSEMIKEFYSIVYPMLEKGVEIFYTIKDYDNEKN